MNITEKQLEKLIDRLAASTRSPRGGYSAASTRSFLDRRIALFRRRRILRMGSSVAAALLLCLSLWSIYLYMAPVPTVTLSTLAENRAVHLPDGTEVILNRYTTLSYPQKFKRKNREVQLQGGAYFAVAKDKEHPFIVQAGAVEVEVLGTEFDIEAYPGDKVITALLFEGAVAVNRKEEPALLLVPGERAVYDKNTGGIFKEKVDDTNDEQAWQQGTFVFNNLPLKEIVRRLSNSFGVEITLADQSQGEQRITSRFIHGESLEEILQLLQEASGSEFTVVVF